MVMNMVSKEKYSRMVKKQTKNSPVIRNCIMAFLIGGAICTFGQLLLNLYENSGIKENDAKTLCSVTLILLGVILTAFHLYEKIAVRAGAGTLVPITGFANSVASPAIEFKSEGFVLGVGAKMFAIAGPVIVYGTTAAVIYGLIFWLMQII